MLLHTDGLIEDRAHTLHEGMQGAARIATDHADRPSPQLCDTLLTRCRQASEHDAFEDDVALLAARLAPNRLERNGSPEDR